MLAITTFVIGLWMGVALMCLINLSASLNDRESKRMDEMDHAQERTEIGLADAIRKASTPINSPTATGRCLWCDEITDDVRRWCDAACRNAWEKYPQ